MLLDRYEQEQALFNKNFKEACSEAGKEAYRGELVLIDGEVADAQGRRKPPHAVLKQATVLAADGKLVLVSGFLDDVLNVNDLLAKYKADFAPGMKAVVFAVNIPNSMIVEAEGATFYLIPLQEGMAWNELIDMLGLEKGDFKGQSSGDKVLTAYKAFADFAPKKFATMDSMEAALATHNNTKREYRGAI